MTSSHRFDPSISRRGLLGGALGLGATAALAGCGFSGGGAAASGSAATSASLAPAAKAQIDGDLVYFNWADYIEPSIASGFKKEYGVKIIETNYDSYAGMMAKLNSGNQYDFVTPGSKEVAELRAAGMLQRIDKTQLKNADQVFGVSPYFDNPWYDPNSDYSVPFTMYLTGIAYRKDKVTNMTGSWNDMWDEAAKGKIFVLDDADEAIGMSALKLGLDINTTNPDDLSKIQADLLSQKPLLRGYSTDDVNNMAGGNAWIHHMWSGDFLVLVTNTVKDPQNYGFIAPKEGTPFGNDTYAIPANAQHPGTALVFIDYLLRPENIDKQINYLGYPMPTKNGAATFAALSKDYPGTQITVADLTKPNVFKTQTPAGKAARDSMWTTVKAS
jgi:spermidine/putrescine transport system substrate-binding protein